MRPLAQREPFFRRAARVLGFYGRPQDDVVLIPGVTPGRAQELAVNGKVVVCPICANNTFRSREGKLQTTGMTFFGLDAFNASAVCHVCTRCGHILWFLPH